MTYEEIIYQANLCWESNHFEKALVLFERANKIRFNKDIALNIGLLYDQLGRLPEAIETYQRLLSEDSTFASGYYCLGVIYEEQNDIEKAIAYYQECIYYDDLYDSAYFNLANIYSDLKEYELAKEAFLDTIRSNKRHFWAYVNFGSMLEQMDQNEEALNYLLKAREIDENSLLYFNLGVVYRKLGKIQDSLHCYEKSLAFDNVYHYAYLNIAVLYKDQFSDLNKALSYYDEGIKKFPELPVLYYNRACIYALKDDSRVYDDLKKCLALDKTIYNYIIKDEELSKVKLNELN